MEILVADLAGSMGEQHRVLGRMDRYVRSVRPLDQADTDSLCFCKFHGQLALDMIRASKAMVIVCSESLEFPDGEYWGKTLIQVTNPRLSFSRLVARYFYRRPDTAVHPSAIVAPEARIGSNVSIGPHSYIGDCQIGDGTIIDGHVHIYAGTKIGKLVVIHAGVVIGAEAVAFERNETGQLEWFPQLAGVTVEDNVEVGSNTVICRGALGDTLIGHGTKIDNLVIVAHGVSIGKDCIVAGGTVICGSARIGNQTMVGPQVCIREGVTVGDRVTVGAGSVVHKDISDDLVVTGSPARPTPKEWVNTQRQE